MDRYTKEKTLLYSGISEQKRKYLRHCIEAAESEQLSADRNKTVSAVRELRNAVTLAAPMRVSGLAAELPAPFTVCAGGRKSVEIAAALETPACDGILISVEYDGRGEEYGLIFGVGNDDAVSYTGIVPLPQSGGKLYLSYDLFAPSPSGAERLVVALDGEDNLEVRIIPEYAYREEAEADTRSVYTEIPAAELSNAKFYKIIDLASNRAVALTPRIKETELRWEQSLIHTDAGQRLTMQPRGRDYTQEWQLYKTEWGKYRIVNKSNANHLQLDDNGKAFPSDVDMNCDAQEFDIRPAGHGKYAIFGAGSKPFVCDNVKSGIWQVFECVYDEWVQTFSDEFAGDALDRGIWDVYNCKLRPDTEPVYFLDRPENFRVEDDNLVIRSADDGCDGIPQTAAYMDTRGLYGMIYGKMEMRARVATGAWIWPAFWSMGIVGNWPYQGEIDVMELVGGGKDNELDSGLFGTLHWATEETRHMEKGVFFLYKNREDLNARYHTYAAEWEYDHLRLYMDDMLYMALNLDSDGKKWGFGDNPHYLILNTSVRGKGSEEAYPDTAKESLYYIDWIRCYKRAGEIAPCDNLATQSAAPAYVSSVAREWLNKVCVSADGRYTAAAGQDGVVYVYGQSDDRLICELPDPQVAVETISFSPDGGVLCVPNRDGDIYIYDCSNFAAAPVHIENIGMFHESVSFTPDGKFIFSGGRDANERGRDGQKDSRFLRAWSIDGALAAEIATGSDVRNTAVSPDGETVAAACSSGAVKVFAFPGLELKFEYDNGTGAAMRGLDFSPKGDLLAFSDESGEICVCRLADGSVRRMDKVNPSSVRRVRFSADGSRLLAVCADNCARLFDVKTGRLAALLGGFSELISEAKYSPDGKHIAVSSYDGTVKLFSADGAFCAALRTENEKGRWVMDMAFSADSRRLYAVMGVRNTDYCVWNI